MVTVVPVIPLLSVEYAEIVTVYVPVPVFEGSTLLVAVPLVAVLDVVLMLPVDIEKYVVIPLAPLGFVAVNAELNVEYPAIAYELIGDDATAMLPSVVVGLIVIVIVQDAVFVPTVVVFPLLL